MTAKTKNKLLTKVLIKNIIMKNFQKFKIRLKNLNKILKLTMIRIKKQKTIKNYSNKQISQILV